MNILKKFKVQFVVLLCFILFVVGTLFSNFIFQITKTKEYKEEIATLKKDIENIDNTIKNTKQAENDNTLESIARERLNMVKSNEIVYIDIKKR